MHCGSPPTARAHRASHERASREDMAHDPWRQPGEAALLLLRRSNRRWHRAPAVERADGAAAPVALPGMRADGVGRVRGSAVNPVSAPATPHVHRPCASPAAWHLSHRADPRALPLARVRSSAGAARFPPRVIPRCYGDAPRASGPLQGQNRLRGQQSDRIARCYLASTEPRGRAPVPAQGRTAEAYSEDTVHAPR